MTDFLQHLINGLSLGAVYALVALGYTLVYGVLQLINFAHSEIVMLGAFAGLFAAEHFSPNPGLFRFAVCTVFAMAACAALGTVIERVAYRPLRRAPKLNSLITAIGVSLLIQSMAQLPWFIGPSPHFFPPLVAEAQAGAISGLAFGRIQVITFVTALTLMAALQRLVFGTRFGVRMRAVAFDSQTAALMGVPADRVVALTFAIGSALGAAGGVLTAMNYPRIEATMGVMLGLKAFVAAVLGGIGNVQGAMLGGLLIGMTESLIAGYGSSSYRDAVVFGILIVILLIRPAGLMGRNRPEKV